MKLLAEIGSDRYDVEITRENRILFAKVDDREYELDVSEPEPGVFLFKHEGRIYEATITDPTSSGERMRVRIGQNEFDVRIIDPKRLRSAGSGADHADGAVEIRTAMPGKVVRVLLQAGANVEKGEGVVVVEAMKMQNELKAPKTGVVRDIRVAEGATVSAGEILATIE